MKLDNLDLEFKKSYEIQKNIFDKILENQAKSFASICCLKNKTEKKEFFDIVKNLIESQNKTILMYSEQWTHISSGLESARKGDLKN